MQVLQEGADRAAESAAITLFNVRQAMGFTPQPYSTTVLPEWWKEQNLEGYAEAKEAALQDAGGSGI